MGILSDVGHALTGTKTDAQNRSDRENDDRKIERTRQRDASILGGDGSVSWDSQAGGFVNSEGQPVSDAQYDQAHGAGSAQRFRDDSAMVWGQNPAQPAPASTNEYLDQGQEYLNGVSDQTTPQTPSDAALAAFKGTGPTSPAGRGAARVSGTGAGSVTSGIDMTGVSQDVFGANANNRGPTGPAAPTLHRDKIDPLLGGINTYANDIYALSKDNTGLSAAEAQLKQVTELANIQAGIATEASQRAALGQARSARNRGDRAFLEQQAIGEAGLIGQEAARTKALTDAQARGDLADVRAKETAYDRDFRLKALENASQLGLNTAALELDISKANLASVTNQLNNDAAFKQLGLQLDQQKAAQVLSFTQAMAALQFQYDKMGVDDQNTTDALLMQKYGIDQQTMVALKQLRQAREVNWGQVLTQMLGGAVAGGAEIGAAYVGNPARVGTSDERAKTNIEEVGAHAAELDELMGALGAYEYEYKEPERDGEGLRFGFMAQELEKTKLGRHMVKPNAVGIKQVEIAPLAFATASGLALVSERLKALEGALK